MTHPRPLDEMILDVVRLIPPATLASYGDVAAVVAGCGHPCTARTVARTLSLYGSDVPWWRVVRSTGRLAPPVLEQGAARLKAEGVPVEGERVPLERLRWEPSMQQVAGAISRHL